MTDSRQIINELEDMNEGTYTVSGFLKEKLTNFYNFLKDNVKSDSLLQEIQKLKDYPLPIILSWIQNDLMTHKDDINEYRKKIFIKYEINEDDYDDAVKNKMCRYFECFIDIC